jgi:xanthine dehydrogenase accessory factor
VVRCERPTSAKPGAKALIRENGGVAGWIGGACAEPVVVREALASMRDGEPRFIRLTADGGPGHTEGVREFAMTCHSGGTLEIYVEPFLPKPLLLLLGHGPVIESLARLGRATDFDVVVLETRPDNADPSWRPLTPRTSVVVGTHGASDDDALEWALSGGAGYVSLIASRKRSETIVEDLKRRGVPVDRVGRLKSPAGIDIGAVTPEEIAVSVLAEIIQTRRSQKLAAREPEVAWSTTTRDEARDPVCGMLVTVATARYRSEVSGRTVYFCCPRCQETYEQDPARFET